MQKLLAVFLVTLLSIGVFAVDITTLDGKSYTNAEVIRKMQNGIIISYKDKNGFNDVLLLNFKNLPAKIKTQYGYKPEVYNEYEKQHQSWMNVQYKKAEKAKAESKKYQQYLEKISMESERITSSLNAQKIKIMFSSLSPIDGGTVGWAREISPIGTEFQSLGRICLLGQTIVSKNKWYGYVYPISMTKKFNLGTSDQSNDSGAGFLPENEDVNPTKPSKSDPTEGEIIDVPCYADFNTALRLKLEQANLSRYQNKTK
ncbi:MAG: hypothetical protein GY756_01125 [bacterium]|nr:hypothetical protein [bacterium]